VTRHSPAATRSAVSRCSACQPQLTYTSRRTPPPRSSASTSARSSPCQGVRMRERERDKGEARTRGESAQRARLKHRAHSPCIPHSSCVVHRTCTPSSIAHRAHPSCIMHRASLKHIGNACSGCRGPRKHLARRVHQQHVRARQPPPRVVARRAHVHAHLRVCRRERQ
jgi:hypothetical protein